MNIELELIKKVLGAAGSFYPTRELTRSRIHGQTVNSGLSQDVFATMIAKGLGVVSKIKTGKTNNIKVFYKEHPSSLDAEVLKQVGVKFEIYRQQFHLPPKFKVDCALIQAKLPATTEEAHTNETESFPGIRGYSYDLCFSSVGGELETIPEDICTPDELRVYLDNFRRTPGMLFIRPRQYIRGIRVVQVISF